MTIIRGAPSELLSWLAFDLGGTPFRGNLVQTHGSVSLLLAEHPFGYPYIKHERAFEVKYFYE